MSNQPTPDGYAPDGPPALYDDPNPDTKVVDGPQAFTPDTPVAKVIGTTIVPTSPVQEISNGTTFTEITAPTSATFAASSYEPL